MYMRVKKYAVTFFKFFWPTSYTLTLFEQTSHVYMSLFKTAATLTVT